MLFHLYTFPPAPNGCLIHTVLWHFISGYLFFFKKPSSLKFIFRHPADYTRCSMSRCAAKNEMNWRAFSLWSIDNSQLFNDAPWLLCNMKHLQALVLLEHKRKSHLCHSESSFPMVFNSTFTKIAWWSRFILLWGCKNLQWIFWKHLYNFSSDGHQNICEQLCSIYSVAEGFRTLSCCYYFKIIFHEC